MWWKIAIVFVVVDGITYVQAGKWEQWSNWTKCSRSCRQGVRERKRLCSGGVPGVRGCKGPWRETEKCTVAEYCPAPIPPPAVPPPPPEDKTKHRPKFVLNKKKKDKGCFDPSDLDSYRGKKAKPMSGGKCQKWKKDKPWAHSYKPSNYPSKNLKKNYCRNPDNDKKPWCFTTKKKLQWDYCDVPICEGTEITTVQTTTEEGATTAAYEDTCGLPEIESSDARKYKGEPPKQKEGRIVKGEEVIYGSIPWIVSLRTKSDGLHFCGGTLYKKRWVLTAARCITDTGDPIPYQAVLGEHTLNETDDYELKMKIVEIILHENFTDSSLENDIALLKLGGPVHHRSHISPICLPPADVIPRNKDEVNMAGWGSEEEGGENSNVLLQLKTNVIDNNKCSKNIAGVTDTLVCAGNFKRGGKGPCGDDEGGPLFAINDDSQYELIGITAVWSEGCGNKKEPGIFTRVSHFIDWIKDTIAESEEDED